MVHLRVHFQMQRDKFEEMEMGFFGNSLQSKDTTNKYCVNYVICFVRTLSAELSKIENGGLITINSYQVDRLAIY